MLCRRLRKDGFPEIDHAPAHVFDVCKQPFKESNKPISKNYFLAVCEQKHLNNQWSQCQINCMANTPCNKESLQECLSGEACENGIE
jgi:hypothetical protein